MAAHTEGRLEAREWNCHAKTTLVRVVDGRIEPLAECSGFGGTAEDSEAVARRLVACWNACIGLPTEAIEQSNLVIAGRREL